MLLSENHAECRFKINSPSHRFHRGKTRYVETFLTPFFIKTFLLNTFEITQILRLAAENRKKRRCLRLPTLTVKNISNGRRTFS